LKASEGEETYRMKKQEVQKLKKPWIGQGEKANLKGISNGKRRRGLTQEKLGGTNQSEKPTPHLENNSLERRDTAV